MNRTMSNSTASTVKVFDSVDIVVVIGADGEFVDLCRLNEGGEIG